MIYHYDSYNKNVLIRERGNGNYPEILHKGDDQWSDLKPHPNDKDELYTRAIWLGEGCWEWLDSITEQQAQEILEEWGYEGN